MGDASPIIETERLRLRPWRDEDGNAFAALNADPEVMADLGGPYDRARSDAKLARYRQTYAKYGYARLAVEDRSGRFLGYCGLMPSRPGHPLGPHVEIGWRLLRSVWGHGYATESARAVLMDGFARHGFVEVLAYTAADNRRSQSVMRRLGLIRDTARDFTALYDGYGAWHGLVWIARPPA